MFIQAAGANCRGLVELTINQPFFDSVTQWNTFKADLHTKLQGAYTSEFCKVLYGLYNTKPGTKRPLFAVRLCLPGIQGSLRSNW